MTHHDHHEDEGHQKARALLQDIKIVMMVTHEPQGGLHARPMQIVGVEDNIVWFFTDVNSGKSMAIDRDHDVLLAASHPEHKEYVSVSGVARVVQDVEKQRALWTEDARPWFPDGAPSEELALIAVRMRDAEYWDSRPTGGFLAFSYIQEQHQDEPGHDNEKVRFGG
jgi:general stress protein 26